MSRAFLFRTVPIAMQKRRACRCEKGGEFGGHLSSLRHTGLGSSSHIDRILPIMGEAFAELRFLLLTLPSPLRQLQLVLTLLKSHRRRRQESLGVEVDLCASA